MVLAFILTLPVRRQVVSSHFVVYYLHFSFSHSTFLAIPEKGIQVDGSSDTTGREAVASYLFSFFIESDLTIQNQSRLVKMCLSSNFFAVSQNHRMFGVGRALQRSSSPTPLPQQGHLQQAAQDLVQAGFEYLQRRGLHSLPGQPVPVLRHPQREENLPHIQTELPVLQFVPLAPCPVAGHYWKELSPILLTPTLQIFVSIY